MSNHNQEFDEIISKITSGLTGNNEADLEFLKEQIELYKDHEMNKEILRSCGRLLYNVLPEETKEEYARAMLADDFKLTPDEIDRIRVIEATGIFSEEELDEMRKGLIKNIRIEENDNTGCKHIRFCSDNGDVYRDISVGSTPKGGDYADAYYLDENFNPTSREKAHWIDIHEMSLNGEMLGDVLGICERKYDAKKWMKREW